jgi:hypothetical protein
VISGLTGLLISSQIKINLTLIPILDWKVTWAQNDRVFGDC